MMLGSLLFVLALGAARAPQSADAPVLRWGGDAEGGAPYVEADAADPTRVVGFDVEVAELVAARLGRRAQFVQIAFTSLDSSAKRGDFELGLGGIEDAPARRAELAVSIPYYEFREVLTVRAADRERFRSLADLRGRSVATLGGTLAYELLLAAEKDAGVRAVSYDDDVHPYSDLLLGRVDAVLLDNVLAERALRRHEGLVTQPESVAVGHYVAISGPDDAAFMARVDAILRDAMRDGTLEEIFRRWKVWNDDQPAFFARTLAEGSAAASSASAPASSAPEHATRAVLSNGEAFARYLPSLLRAASITLLLSCAAMALAIALGCWIAITRVYGGRFARTVCTVYVEVMRGTPVLLQLFVLYYGCASFVRLPAFVAAILGLGLNYAAYESEIYRSALESVPVGQLEAARTLGFTRLQTLRLVRGPQAFRFALAPMTNDFVAMLKDTSLVSVLTVVELTKETQIFATNVGSWVVPGIACAGLYLAMSLPLGHLARRLEARWRAPAR